MLVATNNHLFPFGKNINIPQGICFACVLNYKELGLCNLHSHHSLPSLACQWMTKAYLGLLVINFITNNPKWVFYIKYGKVNFTNILFTCCIAAPITFLLNVKYNKKNIMKFKKKKRKIIFNVDLAIFGNNYKNVFKWEQGWLVTVTSLMCNNKVLLFHVRVAASSRVNSLRFNYSFEKGF